MKQCRTYITVYSLILFGILGFGFSITKKKSSVTGNVIPCKEIDLNCTQSKHGNYVIRTQKEYQDLLIERSAHPDCQNYQLPKIDFNKNDLIGFVSSIAGCDLPKISHEVVQDHLNYNVNVIINKQGDCERNNSVKIWCLIPKSEQSAVFNFNVQKK